MTKSSNISFKWSSKINTPKIVLKYSNEVELLKYPPPTPRITLGHTASLTASSGNQTKADIYKEYPGFLDFKKDFHYFIITLALLAL